MFETIFEHGVRRCARFKCSKIQGEDIRKGFTAEAQRVQSIEPVPP